MGYAESKHLAKYILNTANVRYSVPVSILCVG